jgi:TRAP transporter TAXI family solute receptor
MSILGLCLLILASVYVFFVEAPPPRKLVIASGVREGQYYKFALRYQQILLKQGIDVEVRESKGSIENLEWLLDDSKDVTVALVQSGIADRASCENLNALCSLYREPLWIFQQGMPTVNQLSQLIGKRIAIGPEGSGTRSVAQQLLAINGIDEKNSQLLSATGTEAASLLQEKKIDVVFLVASIEAVYVRQLLQAPEIQILELSQNLAYSKRFHFLSSITLPAGLVDLKANIPYKDTKIIAPTATLIARRSMHPALIALLLGAATKVHGGGDLLSADGEFPSKQFVDLPMDEDAEHFLKSGPPFLQRFLPFWLATFLDRMKLMIIPLVMLLMPLVRATPPLMRWRIRRRIYRWYSQLRHIDLKMYEGMSRAEAERNLQRLSLLDQQVAYVEIPLSYMEEYYNLRVHLDLVHDRVLAILSEQNSKILTGSQEKK